MGAGTSFPRRPANSLRTSPAITDAARGKAFSNFMMALALLKNYHAFQGPKGLTLYDLFKKFDKTWGAHQGFREEIRQDLSGS